MRSPIPEQWDSAYREWLATHKDALLARDWGTAFGGYPWVTGSQPSLSPLRKPLSQARIALVSSAGVSAADQEPFDDVDPFGDASFRAIEGSLEKWQVHHGHYDTAAAKDDYNTVFPLRALQQLAQHGDIGSLSPINYTFMGYQPDPRPFYESTAPVILQGLRDHQVDGVLLVPG